MNTEILVGRLADRSKAYVQIALEPVQQGRLDIEHGPIGVDALRLSISGVHIRPGGSLKRDGDWWGAGQCIDTVAQVEDPDGPWSSADIDLLVTIWKRWHLNDMRAYCAHQDSSARVQGRYGLELDLDQVCEQVDPPYKAGSAWLFERLPQDVVDQARIFQRRLKP